MAEDTFVDQLADIAVTGSLVRLDFANLQSVNAANGEAPTLKQSLRLVMPIEGFLKMQETLSQMIAIMIEKGTIAKRAGGAEADRIAN